MDSERDMSYPRAEPLALPSYPLEGPRPAVATRPPLTKRMRAVHWMAIDVIVSTVAALIGMFVLASPLRPAPFNPGPFGPNVVADLVLAALIFFPVALRRRSPATAFGVLVTVAAAVADGSTLLSVVLFLAAAYVLYLVTAVGNKQTGLAALALALVVIALIVVADREFGHGGAGSYVPVAFALIIAWMTGYSVRQRRLYAQTLQQQAASSAVAEERLRIARELHDVVAHSMSVIAVQAGYGQYVIDASPADARDALGAIQATSRDALEEMRRMLGVLRQQDVAPPLEAAGAAGAAGAGGAAGAAGAAGAPSGAPGAASGAVGAAAATLATSGASGGSGAAGAAGAAGVAASRPQRAPLAPAPGLCDLDRLIQRTCGAGVQVSVERSGRVRAVPAGVDLSAFRIIQEALTNVVKHAGGGARCMVSLGYGDTALEVRVSDDGGRSLMLTPSGVGARSTAGAGGGAGAGVRAGVAVGVWAGIGVGAGHGLIGMRERANLCGGRFSAGPLPEGGWGVTATLPMLATATPVDGITITAATDGAAG